MMPDRAKNFFFTSLVHQTRTLHILVVQTQNPLVQRKKKALPKQISCGWLRCHNKNHWIMNQRYPEKGCYSCHKQRDVFSKLHKTLNSWPRQIQPTKNSSFHACLNRRTQDSLCMYFSCFRICRAIILIVWDCLLSFPYTQFSGDRTDSLCSTFRTPWISLPF